MDTENGKTGCSKGRKASNTVNLRMIVFMPVAHQHVHDHQTRMRMEPRPSIPTMYVHPDQHVSIVLLTVVS